MKLQGRNLSAQMQGEDVNLLLSELCQLGYRIADAELDKNLFGETTRQAVLEFQKEQGISVDAIVGEQTALQLDAEIAQLLLPHVEVLQPSSVNVPNQHGYVGTKPEAQPAKKPFHVKGAVRWFDGRRAVDLTVRAFDKDLRREELLGTTAIDKDGRYEIG